MTDEDKKTSTDGSKDGGGGGSGGGGGGGGKENGSRDAGSKDGSNKESSKESNKDAASKDDLKESTKENKKSDEDGTEETADSGSVGTKKTKNSKTTTKDDDTDDESNEDDDTDRDGKATKDETIESKKTVKQPDTKSNKSKKSNKNSESSSSKSDAPSKKRKKSQSKSQKKAKNNNDSNNNDSKENGDNDNTAASPGSNKSTKSRRSKQSKKSNKSGSKSHKTNNNTGNMSVSQNSQKSIKAGGSSSSTKSKKTSLVRITPKDKTSKIDFSGCRIGFIGAGKMTEAITRGLVVYGKLPVSKLYVASKTFKNLDGFKTKGVNVTKRMYDIFGQNDCDIVFMAVHGNVIRACFRNGGSRPSALAVNYIPNQKHPVYILSLIGGVSLGDIRITLLDPEDPDKYIVEMHRVMLNIGVSYGMGLGLIDVEPDSKQCSPVVRDLLTKLAKIEYFPEEIMDAACAIGGNGLAFCFYFMSALADGGFKMGLNKQMSIKLAAKTLQAASQCLLESNKHPSELQDSVTSSAGPAIYGINVLEKTDCAAGFQSAVDVAYLRIKELVETG